MRRMSRNKEEEVGFENGREKYTVTTIVYNEFDCGKDEIIHSFDFDIYTIFFSSFIEYSE